MSAWVIWSELQFAWRQRLPSGIANGYTKALARAGLFEQNVAEATVARANSGCEPGEWIEWALPDPLGRTI